LTMLLFALSNAVELRSHIAAAGRKPMPLSHRDPGDPAVIAPA